jgi:hypothetical protein
MVLLDGEDHAGFNARALGVCRAEGLEPEVVRIANGHVTAAFLRTGGFMLVPALAALSRVEGVGFAKPETAATLPYDLVWRDEPLAPALARFLAVALTVARDAPWQRLRENLDLRPPAT